MTKTVGVRQFKNEATRIVRDVREHGAEYVITVNGEPAARLVPLPNGADQEDREERIRRHLEEVDRLAKKIGAAWKSPLTAVESVSEQRR